MNISKKVFRMGFRILAIEIEEFNYRKIIIFNISLLLCFENPIKFVK